MLGPVTFSLKRRLDYATQAGSVFAVNVLPARTHQQQLAMEVLRVQGGRVLTAFTEPATATRFVQVAADGPAVSIELEAQVRLLQREHDARARRHDAAHDLLGNAESLRYLTPSRYCQSDSLDGLCRREFLGIGDPFDRARAIESWVHRTLQPLPAAPAGLDSAVDTLIRRGGSPREFAHLMIALCRASRLPARYVTTIPFGAQSTQVDMHAWVEVLIDEAWLCFEPTRACPRTALIRIGTGRDGAEVPTTIVGSGAASARHAESVIESLGIDEPTLRERDRASEAILTATLGSLVEATRWHQEARQAIRSEPRRLPGATPGPVRGAGAWISTTTDRRSSGLEMTLTRLEPI